MTKITKGWKNFNKDLKCRDFQFEVGRVYEHKGKIELCGAGFHFHETPLDLFTYYAKDLENVLVCEVEAIGEVISKGDKSVCGKIKIIRQLSIDEVKSLCNLNNNTGFHNSGRRNSGYYNSGNYNSGRRNSGYYNSGNSNSGNYNSGYSNSGDHNSGSSNSGNYNSGYYNSGDHNSGDHNSGDHNSGDHNSGYFNTTEPEFINVFKKPLKREIWSNANKPKLLCFDLTIWVHEDNMTDQEKINHPEFFCQKGYLKTIAYKEAFQKSFEKASDDDKKLLYKLPNFDPKIFEEISGIDVTKDPTFKVK